MAEPEKSCTPKYTGFFRTCQETSKIHQILAVLRVSKKRTAVNTMTEQEKEQILRKMKNREQGDVASNDDDLVRSEKYMKKGQYARSKYKEFYDDVKLSIKEDW
ncbi:MAG: hypothetical protein KH349_07440 [Clostridium sp.]|nr:hypothetical protein [Clostridium sp.]